MAIPGSDSAPRQLPVPMALAAVAFGLVAMLLTSGVVAPHGLRLTLVVSETALVLPALAAVVAYGVPWGRGVGFTRLDRRTALLVAACGAGLWAASLGLFELQYAVWPPPEGYLELFRRLHEQLRPKGAADALVSLAAIALVPALAEETLVRGVVLPSLLPRLGPAGAVLVSALVFAGLHMDAYRALFTLALGIALGVLRLATGSLTATVLAHAVVNAITFVAAPLTDPGPEMPEPQPLLGAAFLLVGGAASGWLLRRLSLTGSRPRP